MIMTENKGDYAATNPQLPVEGAPPAYPMPQSQFAPTPVPAAPSPPAPASPHNQQPPLQAAPHAYPMPQFAPTPASFAASPYAPAPLNPANVAVLGQQYRDQLFAQCAVGNHERTTTYGIAGIIMAIVCFPCGLIGLFLDTEVKCARCGLTLDKR